jgi:hypothetical protein
VVEQPSSTAAELGQVGQVRSTKYNHAILNIGTRESGDCRIQ